MPSRRSSRTHVTVLNHGRDDAIVLCFHPLGGELLAYRPLVAFLGLSATVYGMQSRASAWTG
jgi:hypothetical protein